MVRDSIAKILITPSEIIEYLYCPRFIYFMNCLQIGQNEQKRFKIQKGRDIHKDKTKINKDYLRKKIGATGKEIDVYLSSNSLYLRGIVDEVLTLKDGTMAPLDYKFAEYKKKQFVTYFNQSLAYGLMISENYSRIVKKGFIVYTRSHNKLVSIEFTEKNKDQLKNIIDKILRIIHTGHYPKKTSSRLRCHDCTYRGICT